MGVFDFLKKFKNDMTSVDVPVKAQPVVPAAVEAKKENKETFKVAGVSYRQKEIRSLGTSNEDYKMTKAEIVDCGMTNERIYQYRFDYSDIQIVPEPDNPEDPKALKVLIDGVHVGYIKKTRTSRMRNLMKLPGFKVTAEIFGGKYKRVNEFYDDEKEDDVAYLDNGVADFGVHLTVTWDDPDGQHQV